LFEQFGDVSRASVVIDRETGRSRGFGFVEMSNPSEGDSAIDALDGTDFEGRALRVNEARPREPRAGGGRPPRGNGGGGGGFRGGGGGGGAGFGNGGRDGDRERRGFRDEGFRDDDFGGGGRDGGRRRRGRDRD